MIENANKGLSTDEGCVELAQQDMSVWESMGAGVKGQQGTRNSMDVYYMYSIYAWN